MGLSQDFIRSSISLLRHLKVPFTISRLSDLSNMVVNWDKQMAELGIFSNIYRSNLRLKVQLRCFRSWLNLVSLDEVVCVLHRLQQWRPFWNRMVMMVGRQEILIILLSSVAILINGNRLDMQDRWASATFLSESISLNSFDTLRHLVVIDKSKLIRLRWNIGLHSTCISSI